MKFVNVNTHCGPVKGLRKTSVLGREYSSFTNIPYMQAPVGKLRFRDPQEPEKWTEPLDATRTGENYSGFDPTGSGVVGRDDAAFINVHTPDIHVKKLLPVMVHFITSGNEVQGPDYLLQKDVVVVTFNHRIGPLGYLSFKDPELGIPGNAGLKDQIAALKWIQKNIANFGGDPDNVTLFGCSHGSYSINYMMIFEQAKGLFHKAIMMAGSVFSKSYALTPPGDWNVRLAKHLKYEGDSTNERDLLEFFTTCDASELMAAIITTATSEETVFGSILNAFAPVIEPYITSQTLIYEDPMLMARKAWSKDMNLIIGYNSHEGLLMRAMAGISLELLKKNESGFAPLRDLGLKPDDQLARKLGKRMKETYYGKLDLSTTNVEPFVHYTTDSMFGHGIQRWIQSRINSNGNGKNFLYRFAADNEMNYFKNELFNSSDFPGACHGDEVMHLFKLDETVMKNVKLPAIDSTGFKVSKLLISLWTNFAKTGDPNNHELETVWEPVTSKKTPMSLLNIDNEGCQFIPHPDGDRLAVWDSMFEDAKVVMY